ncbi:HTTM domain-containing protein [Hazenella sp. IB182353]|nr:HTTM domain-containing protein [Polycladospora coralii]
MDHRLKAGKAKPKPKPLSNSLHNLAVATTILQLCFLYLSSGLHKVMGEMWTNGTALYYILQVGEYTHPFFQRIISSSDIILMISAYSAIFIQLSFPFLLLNRYTKYIAMFNIIALHTGIAIIMGLFTFSAIMISIQFLMLSDGEYKKAFAYISLSATKVKQKFQNGRVENYDTKQIQ